MIKNIAIIDKCPSKTDYSKYFDFKYDLFHLSSIPLQKVLKKDLDIDIELDLYDLIILVGSEAAKEYAGITSVTNFSGILVKEKFICITNPSILIFKPDGKQDFDKAVSNIKKIVQGQIRPAVSGDFRGINNELEAKNYLLEVLNSNTNYISMDTEGTALYPRDGYVIGISISYKPAQGRYIVTDVIDEEIVGILQKILDTKEVIFHNKKYDIKMLRYHLNLKFKNNCHDTMLMHYVLDENGEHGLKVLALKYTNYGDYDSELEEFKDNYCRTNGMLKEHFTYDLIPFEIIYKYACIDTAATLEIFYKFKDLIDNNNKLSYVYNNLLSTGTDFLMDMEEVGIPISVKKMVAADSYLDEQIEKAKNELYSYEEIHRLEQDQGAIFNPNSVVQLRKLLFDYIGLTPTGKRTGTGAISTDAEVLEELSYDHPIPKALLNIRKLTKVKNTYITKILSELDSDQRIRTNFNLIFTTSGRLSSSGKFNAQQIIRDDPIIKGCIEAPEGYSIVSQDLVTGEMYYAAVLSGDKNLQKLYSGDFHSSIAKMVFDLPCSEREVKGLFPELRQSAKAISFGILYGSGPDKVAESVRKATKKEYPIDRAEDDIRTYFTKFPTLKKWLQSRKDFIKTNGYTYSFFGRKRRLLNVFSADKGIASHEIRSGINFEIQSLCSDINLLGAMETQKECDRKNLDAKIFMLVHDSIVALVRDDIVEEYCEIVKRNTQKDRGCSIPGTPIGVDQSVGKDYSFGDFDKTYKIIGNKLSRI